MHGVSQAIGPKSWSAIVVGLAVLVLVVGAGTDPASAQVQLKAEGAELCLPCHAELEKRFAQGHVHTPVAMGLCQSCHNPHAAKFPKLLVRQGADLCFSCHGKAEAAFKKKVVHRPVKDGQCTACHDPHAAPEKFQLARAGAQLCLTCHARLAETPRKVAHPPFEAGDCLLCHEPHASDQRALLTSPSGELCQFCHDLSDPKVKRAHGPFPVAQARCEQCHDPHGSDHKGLAKAVTHPPFAQGRCGSCHQVNAPDPRQTILSGKDLCLTCHAKLAQTDLRRKQIHVPVEAGLCTTCHSPHASALKALLVERERTLCLDCHTEVEERFKTARAAHPEKAADGRCTACHTPHGSDQPNLFAGEPLKVCASCHGQHAALSHPMGAGIADPRTQKTLDCMSCHDPHGTAFPAFVTHAKERQLCVQCHKGLR